jgi:hypothetical protein
MWMKRRLTPLKVSRFMQLSYNFRVFLDLQNFIDVDEVKIDAIFLAML